MKQLWGVVLAVALAFSLRAADKKKKPPDLQVLEASARRGDGKIAVDGRVRNTSEKPMKVLILLFDFLAPGKLVITTQKAPVEEELLAPGKEAVFRVELKDPVRAVAFQINAADEAGHDFRVANPGPFPIE